MIRPSVQAKAVLDAIRYVTLATVTPDGEPWNTPLATFRFGNDYVLYWASWHNNQHSQNIRTSGKAFAVVYDSTPADGQPAPGVYMTGKAYEISDKEEAMRAALVFGNDPYNPSDGNTYLNDYPRRIYKFIPEKVWMNDDGEVNGNFIDIRKEAEA